MEYTKEQIETAYHKTIGPFCSKTGEAYKAFIAELEKPKPVFKVGEVVAADTSSGTVITFCRGNADFNSKWRHLNLTENPSTALAIERFERLASGFGKPYPGGNLEGEVLRLRRYAQKAIDDVKKIVG